jgi:hypothetical protein
MSLLEFRDISDVYGEGATAVHALDDIDLSVEPAMAGPGPHRPEMNQ